MGVDKLFGFRWSRRIRESGGLPDQCLMQLNI